MRSSRASSILLDPRISHAEGGCHEPAAPWRNLRWTTPAQHRGRIFLPFADDDPRTAEIVAKAVLLARDDKITDPTILRQLVH